MTATAVASGAAKELAARLSGALVLPGDPGYDEARGVWNGMIERHPALVARCAGPEDVAACVHFARAHDLVVAVRGGGHSVAGYGTCDGGIVIDLSPMREVQVDAAGRRVRAEGGATWGDVDRHTQAFGLAAPGGVVSTTGIGGLTLGGGQGWLRRTVGMTCDNVLSAEVVTADGEVVVASDAEHADLLWALKGGGGNFGVVTAFTYRLHRIGPDVLFAGPTFPAASARQVLSGFAELMAAAPHDVNANAIFWTVPDLPEFPPHARGRDALTVAALYAGPPDAGAGVLQPFGELADPFLDLGGVVPYTQLQSTFDPFFPKGVLHYYFKALYLDRLDGRAVAGLASAAASRPSPLSMVSVWALGGALSEVDPDATPLGARTAPFLVEILAAWSGPHDTASNVRWARELWQRLHAFSPGTPNLNFPGLGEEGQSLVRAAYGAHYDRLAAIKAKYDPTNVFRLNQNIPPADARGRGIR